MWIKLKHYIAYKHIRNIVKNYLFLQIAHDKALYKIKTINNDSVSI